MPQLVREVMSPKPVALESGASLTTAAEQMRDNDIGNVVVLDDGRLLGIVTDRDIVIRAIAAGKRPNEVKLREICTDEPVTVAPDDSAEEAVKTMRDRAIRRLPVVDGGAVVGIVSLGDLAVQRDERSVLADISKAPADN